MEEIESLSTYSARIFALSSPRETVSMVPMTHLILTHL